MNTHIRTKEDRTRRVGSGRTHTQSDRIEIEVEGGKSTARNKQPFVTTKKKAKAKGKKRQGSKVNKHAEINHRRRHDKKTHTRGKKKPFPEDQQLYISPGTAHTQT
jgi:hypothetical protein